MRREKKLSKILLFFVVLISFSLKVFADTAWINDLRTLFLSNNAIIYGINIRTFNAKDKNGSGIIEENLGEQRGNFINAVEQLNNLPMLGINTVHLLSVLPVGTTKARGTAGSLYAVTSFNEINPQLKSNGKSSAEDEFKFFVNECHKKNLRVIVDLPAYVSYDLYLRHPEYFIKDKNGMPIAPPDSSDVRILDAGNNNKINEDVYALYQSFLDFMIEAEIDGVVANSATVKPYEFWKKLINDTRGNNPEFLFLAQASKSDKPVDSACFTSYERLLDAGFDGYYGDYSKLSSSKNSGDLISHVKSDISLSKRFSKKKRVLGDFATREQISPILVNGPQLSKMIVWLNSTLPLNPYYLDGFITGDTYIYPLMNKKASASFTDDNYYFVQRGKLDIYNFSRSLVGKNIDIFQEFILANKFRKYAQNLISNGDFISLRTSSSSVFAYERNLDDETLIVFGNLDFKRTLKANVYSTKINPAKMSVPVKLSNIPKLSKGKISTDLDPGEIQVIYFGSPRSK